MSLTKVHNRMVSGAAVNVKDFGAVGDGVTDDTAAIQAALTYANTNNVKLIAPSGGIYLYTGTERQTYTSAMRIDFNGSSLLFGSSASDHVFVFSGGLYLKSMVIDGGANSFCSVIARQAAPIWTTGGKTTIDDVTIKNFLGLENRSQYGIQCDISYDTLISNSVFEEIYGVTNTANTSGFCGGVFITNDGSNVHNILEANHIIENSRFESIRTTPNGAASLVPDSDAIRLFVYDHGTLTAGEQATIGRTTLTVKDCKFLNVLKSGVKVPYVSAWLENLSFSVTELSGHSSVYAAFRMQVGKKLSAKNISVQGSGVVIGVLADCDQADIENITFNSDYTSSDAVFIGGTSSDQISSVRNIYVTYSNHAVSVSTSGTTYIDGIYDVTGAAFRTAFVRYISSPNEIYVSNVYSSSDIILATAYNSSSSFNKLSFDNVKLDSGYAGNLFNLLANVGTIEIKNSNIFGGYNALISSSYVDTFLIDNVFLGATGSNIRLINLISLTTFKADKLKIVDTRSTASDHLLNIEGDQLIFKNIEIDSSPSVYTALIAVLRTDNNSTGYTLIDDIYVEGSIVNKQAMSIEQGVHARVTNADLNYSTSRFAYINITQAILGWLSGQLSGSPVASPGTTLTEVAGTRVTY